MSLFSNLWVYFIVVSAIDVINGQLEEGPGGVKIGLNGKIYSFDMNVCSGGIFFKKPIQPQFICLNGYFLKRGSGCRGTQDQIIAASQYACHQFLANSEQIQLLVPITNSEFPTEHTVTFYQDVDLLSDLRRYNYMYALQGKYGVNGTETGARYVLVSNTHNTVDVNIGKVCYDGVLDEEGKSYMLDLGEGLDFSDGAQYGFFKKECHQGSYHFDFSKAKTFPFFEGESRDFQGEITAKFVKGPSENLMPGLEDLLDRTPIFKTPQQNIEILDKFQEPEERGGPGKSEKGGSRSPHRDSRYPEDRDSKYSEERGGPGRAEEGGSRYVEDQDSRYPEEGGSRYTEDQDSRYPEDRGSRYPEDQDSRYPEEREGPGRAEEGGSRYAEDQDSRYPEDRGSRYPEEHRSKYLKEHDYGSNFEEVEPEAISPWLDLKVDTKLEKPLPYEPPPQPITTHRGTPVTTLMAPVKWILPHYKDPLIETNIKIAQFKLLRLSGKEGGNPLDDVPSEAKWFQILVAAKEVAKSVLLSDIIPEGFLEAAVNYFGYFHRSLPDNEEDLDEVTFNTITSILAQCARNPYPERKGPKVTPLANFTITYRSCPPQFVSVKLKDETGVEVDDRLEMSPPDGNKYHPDSNDAVVETMWNLLDITFVICASEFHDDFSAAQRMMVYMQELVFLHPDVQNRWFERVNSVQDYQAYLPSGNLVNTMRNIDKFKGILHSEAQKINYGYWFDKPKIHRTERRPKFPRRRRPFPAWKKLTFTRKNSLRHRREVDAEKRSRRTAEDLAMYEIWNGLAFCLQTAQEYNEEQELVERGFLPSLIDLKQGGFC